ncbi:AMP-binding protein [Microbacterium horticulturae]|uniref:AMP-binding protein n=1 Tax=Microbacterium horticulturae TaxID=3028316 RepID=A0ABY8BXZ1_9MICO|nr:AMP-binding protein [Microbacterium sp. KACC 23027]WEG07987.1 AMP-binding protein [Microbacterium sp. KACC 23027]
MRAHYADVWQAVAAAVPDREAIRSIDGEVWTYERFARDAGALAAGLARLGVQPGDRVALLLHNRPEFLVTVFACLAAGIVPVPLNYRLRAHEVADLIDDAGARILLAPTSLEKTARDAAAAASAAVVWILDAGLAEPSWAQLTAVPAPLPAPPDDGELWLYTGGTTGRPKAVRWDEQEMFEAQMAPTYSVIGADWPRTVDDAVRIAADPATPRVVTLPLSPFLHGTALTTAMNTLTLGGTVLVTSSPRLDADAAVDFAAAASATRLIVAGDGVAVPLVEAAERHGVRLPAVQTVISSGMRFSPDTKERLHALGEITIIDMLASTEGGVYAATTTTGAHDLPGRPRLFPSAVVLDQELHEVQERPGALGILAQRGALPLGYHGDPEKTAATFPVIDGVRHVMPGDWVRVEDDRHIEFLGRGSAVINTGGEKVYPLEVEEVLLEHPAVADAVVLGVPDARFGEIVTAVVARQGEVTADELSAFVDERLAGYKRPRHILFRASLDRTPTGKVDMAGLRDEISRDR